MGVFGTGGPPGASFPREEWGKGPSALWPSVAASLNSCLVDRVRKGGEAARGHGALPRVVFFQTSPACAPPPFRLFFVPFLLLIGLLLLERQTEDELRGR